MAPSNTQLPVELLFQIFSLGLPLADLAVLSRVCHTWYQIIFPLLYETVYLSWDAPIFAARILDEHLARHTLLAGSSAPQNRCPSRPSRPIDGLRVTDYVQSLVVDTRISRQSHKFYQLESDIITSAFPMLKKLKKIDWTLPWLPNDTEMFRALSQHCRSMEHFSFNIPINMDRYRDSRLEDMFSFSNLKHIRLQDFRLPHDSDTHGHVASSLVAMILRSPGLEYLELELGEDPNDERHVGLWLVEAIAPVLEHTFEHLRGFVLKAFASIDSEHFVRADQHNLVRNFLFRHPKLHTLDLPWDWGMNNLINEPIQDCAEALRGALPGLRHFAGPTYLVILFLQLDIAQNLERLGIVDTGDDEESDLLDFVPLIPRLPNLRRLDFLSTYMLDCTSFSETLKATPNITELTLNWVDGSIVVTKAALSSLPNLKYLNLGFNVLPYLTNRVYKTVSKEEESREVFQLAQ
ncbi:hypothetical protein FS749_002279, partial [Ceratobasidium sp. UAMH 11750]